MKELRKRILLELFVTPMTIIPLALGATAFMLSFVFGGVMTFLSFISTLIGFGAMLTNFVFNMKGVSERAMQQWRKSEKKKQDATLDALELKLKRTTDTTDDETHLANLRELYRQFCEDVEQHRISEHTPPDMLDQIDQMFRACVHSLEESYEIYRMTQKMKGDLKKGMSKQRKDMIDNVGKSVSEMANAINEVRSLKLKANNKELDQIRKNLHRSLSVCQNRDQAYSELNDEMDRFDEYTKEYDIK